MKHKPVESGDDPESNEVHWVLDDLVNGDHVLVCLACSYENGVYRRPEPVLWQDCQWHYAHGLTKPPL